MTLEITPRVNANLFIFTEKNLDSDNVIKDLTERMYIFMYCTELDS